MTRTPTLGTTIRARRIELGWSQEELAERISGPDGFVRQSEVSRLELDKVALPRRTRLERIAAALDLPLGELLVRSGWSGAETAIQSRTATTATASAAATPPPPLSPPSAAVDSAPASLAMPPAAARESPKPSVRLHAALERSRDLRLQTAAVLDRVRRTYDRVTAPSSNGQGTR